MDAKITFSIDEAHRHFAKSINNRVWELLQKPERSSAENDEMLYAVHACAYHWKFVGTVVHQQRAEWLISRVHVALGQAHEALRHAERCFELTESNKDLMKDFDVAYTYEGLARAYAMTGSPQKAREFYDLAQKAGKAIVDEEDQSIFIGDFEGGDWFGWKTFA